MMSSRLCLSLLFTIVILANTSIAITSSSRNSRNPATQAIGDIQANGVGAEKDDNNTTQISTTDIAKMTQTISGDNGSDVNVLLIDEDDKRAIRGVMSRLVSWIKSSENPIPSQTGGLKKQHNCGLQRPFVTLAYAQTLDGMIAAKIPNISSNKKFNDKKGCTLTAQSTSNMKLSSAQSMKLTHFLRSCHDGILVGGSTFLVDEPRLNVRLTDEDFIMLNQDYDCCSDSVPNRIRKGKQPIPIILDTHLNNLQRLLWGEILGYDWKSEQNVGIKNPGKIYLERVRAYRPIICCSLEAMEKFTNILESFQKNEYQIKNFAYDISIQKRDYAADGNDGQCGSETLSKQQPIEVFIREKSVTAADIGNHDMAYDNVDGDINNKTFHAASFILLPCPIDSSENILQVQQMLHILNTQFNIRTLMVEGGSSILSSFMNSSSENHSRDDHTLIAKSSEPAGIRSRRSLVDCICVTIAPGVLGGKCGLPSLAGFNALSDTTNPHIVHFRDGHFVTLGPDAIFIGQIN
ncbi:hypothetical protein ACHAXS_001747 [Conticribra weissflogii]